MTQSDAELLLAEQLRQAGIPFEQEYEFAPEEWCRAHGFLSPVRQLPRKWRADFKVIEPLVLRTIVGDLNITFHERLKVLVEIDGGGFIVGHHSRGKGIEDDCEKQSAAAILGYRVIRCTPRQVNDGTALEWIRAALGLEVAA